MTARPRDVTASAVLVGGILLGLLAWHPFGRWAAFAIVVVSVLAAAVVYRLRPSAVPWHGEPAALHGRVGAREGSHRD